MRKGDLEKIAAVIKKHDLLVLSDEIYSELTYGDEEVQNGSLITSHNRAPAETQRSGFGGKKIGRAHV